MDLLPITMEDVIVQANEVKYSGEFQGGRDQGVISAYVKSTGPAIITLQTYSPKAAKWLDPKDCDGNAIGKVFTFAAAGEEFVAFPLVLADSLRFKIATGLSDGATVTIEPFIKI